MSSLGLITPYFSENRLRILIGLLSLIVVDVVQLVIPRVIKWAVDDLAAMRAEGIKGSVYSHPVGDHGHGRSLEALGPLLLAGDHGEQQQKAEKDTGQWAHGAVKGGSG